MKKVPYLLILFFCNVSAQLTVRNNHYIFVKDQVLFVNDNVNLQESDAKMYLRDDAQLVQGTGVTGNSGEGQLSVYQNGTTHNYAYNYWCSPVGNNSLSFGNENFSVNLLDDATGLISSTDAAFTSYDGFSSPLTIARYWIYTFENASSYSQWMYKADTGAIAPGLGFTMKGTSDSSNNQLYDFRGKANNGTITNSVASSQWTLVGNPYPSALDAVAYIHDTDNQNAITGTLYYWEQDLSVMSHNVADYVGGYATYTINAAGTLETFIPATFDTYNSDGTLNTTGNTSTSSKRARRYIPVGQGFMVEGSSTTSGVVQSKNTHRVYYKQSNIDSEFFRSTDVNDVGLIENSQTANNHENTNSYYGVIPPEYKRFRLNIDFNNTYTRQLVQTFHDTEATAGFDYGLESKSPLGVASDAFWIINEEPYIAQALPYNIEMTIPLHINVAQNTTVRIRTFDVQNFSANQAIYIHDKQLNQYHDISNGFFEIALSQGEYTDRFEVTFLADNNVLGFEQYEIENLLVLQDKERQQLIVQNPNLLHIESIQLYDMLGRKVLDNKGLKKHDKYIVDTTPFNEGVYIVKIIAKNHKEYSKKVIIKRQ
ncbi:T9SS type A sorting domain-containing protein [Kordia algicida OT-1]|uniref:Secretion system C-terminal sorting domain-containing protein n=1 Tax=Kordia algicida OT-1 TaxID=391587 RepID=A9E1Z1_9FLAO|nr:T9SS type A sorting domain-containing protein [Kordia algicida]EDP95692.1 hypothetical protein KAOT1_22611 [Kordia algicida OT-1]